jgi:hypothetical protein
MSARRVEAEANTESPASVYRAWSSWNSFFGFLVVEGIVAGTSGPRCKPAAAFKSYVVRFSAIAARRLPEG